MNNSKNFSSHLLRILKHIDQTLCHLTYLLYEAIRPQLGPVGTCIYPVSCGDFARIMLKTRSFPIALAYICWRLFTCNPITVLIRKLRT